MRWRSLLAVAGCFVVALGAAACGDDDASSSTSTAAAEGAAAGSGGLDDASVELAATFTGGKAGTRADASLEPMVIGFANQNGGSPAYPEYTAAAKAAVKLVNDHLGGVDGHPVTLDTCILQSEEDGQKCAAQFLANPKIHIINFSLSVVGNQSFHKTIGGRIPEVVSVAATGPDYTTPHVYTLSSAGDGIQFALSADAEKRGARSVAIVASDNPAGKFAVTNVLTPRLEKLGISSKAIYVSDSATTPDFASALQAGGAAKADMVILIPSGVPACQSTYDALKQLAITKPVATNFACYGDPMPAHTGGGPADWDMFGLTTNQRIVNPETTLFTTAMAEAGESKYTYVGSGLKSFSDILAITHWANDIGFDKLSPKAFEQAILDWTGPHPLVPGNVHCGRHPTYVGVCGDSAEGSTYKDGTWVSLGAVQSVTLKP